MGIYTSCADTLGGVIKFSDVFMRINGFPNDMGLGYGRYVYKTGLNFVM